MSVAGHPDPSPVAERISEELARIDTLDAAEHADVYEALDAALRAEVRALEAL